MGLAASQAKIAIQTNIATSQAIEEKMVVT
jgi:hypothetical protein